MDIFFIVLIAYLVVGLVFHYFWNKHFLVDDSWHLLVVLWWPILTIVFGVTWVVIKVRRRRDGKRGRHAGD